MGRVSQGWAAKAPRLDASGDCRFGGIDRWYAWEWRFRHVGSHSAQPAGEDGADPPELLAAKIGAARTRARQRGLELFVNARTDVYLRGLASGAAAVDETLRRLRLYREAGADGAFVPLLFDLEQIRAIADACAMPLNVMVVPGLADAAALAAAGVARISLGGGAFLASLSLASRIAEEFVRQGTYAAMHAGTTMTHRQANGLFA